MELSLVAKSMASESIFPWIVEAEGGSYVLLAIAGNCCYSPPKTGHQPPRPRQEEKTPPPPVCESPSAHILEILLLFDR